MCPWSPIHTTVAAAGQLLLLLLQPPPPAPPRPPRGKESLGGHGGDFRAADQSSGWMSAAAGGSGRILIKLTRIDHRGSNQLISSHPVPCGRQKHRPPSCPVLCLSRAPASCSARCCAPTPKSRRNPVRQSAAGTPESHGAGGVGGSQHLRTEASHRRLVFSFPTGEPKLVYLSGKSQPAKLDKQHELRLRRNTAQNKLQLLQTGRPAGAGELAPPVCRGPHGGWEHSVESEHSRSFSGPQTRARGCPRGRLRVSRRSQRNDVTF